MTFSNAPGSLWSQPANQDQIAGDVWLTRSGSAGIFNAALESAFTKASSPAGTEWALGDLANYATLTYTNWTACFGGKGNLQTTITSTNSVLHLINEDIYLTVTFTFWGGNGGGFTYERSTPYLAPEPRSNLIFLGGTFLLFLTRKMLRR